jgi:glycosyltransferase involved in cell wall biosynthesis
MGRAPEKNDAYYFKISHDMTSIYIDTSAMPDIGGTVTGISRVLLCVMRHLLTEHPEVELQGISFRDEDQPYRLLGIPELCPEVRGLVDFREGTSEGVREPKNGDVVLLLGEQWLFQGAFSGLEKLKRERSVKIVSMVHDLVPFLMPELYWEGFSDAYIYCISRQVGISDVILVYSKNTRKDLFNHFPQLLERPKSIKQIRLGDDFEPSYCIDGDLPLSASLPKENFILCVGTIQPRKNHSLLLAVWRRLLIKYKERCPTLLLVGKKGWLVDDLCYFIQNNRELRSKIKIVEQVSDNDLRELYRACLFCVFPSLYEGWGLPIAECLAAHRFCLVSDTSAMPEVGGSYVDYFSPYDSGQLYALIDRYIADPLSLRRKTEIIEQNFKPVLWSSTTTEILEACRMLRLNALN